MERPAQTRLNGFMRILRSVVLAGDWNLLPVPIRMVTSGHRRRAANVERFRKP
jgi:hypothetical protein